MLSFDRGDKEIAIIHGGIHDKKILKIYFPKEKVQPDLEYEYPEDILSEDFYHKNLGMRYTREAKISFIEPVRQAMSRGDRKVPKSALKLYYAAKRELDDKSKKELMLRDGTLIPLPLDTDEEIVENIFIAGPAGSGKSTWTGNYIKYYKKMFPKNSVWVFSRLDSDKALDKYDIKRIELDDGLLENPLDAKELAGKYGTLVIFDDIDTIPDPEINKEVHRLRDDLLETGRHAHISVLSTGHQLMDYKKTRTLLNEASAVTFFPKSGSTYHISRFLKIYGGLDNKMIKKILSLPSRWITFYKTYPMFVLFETGALLI